MKANARTATASDFEAAAQSWANSTWLWGLLAAVVGYFAGWFALIPGVFALLSIINSVTATSMAGRLRAGTYTISNPNNGVPAEPRPAAIPKTEPMASSACNAPRSRSLYGTPNTPASPITLATTPVSAAAATKPQTPHLYGTRQPTPKATPTSERLPAAVDTTPKSSSLYGAVRTRKISPAAIRNDDR